MEEFVPGMAWRVQEPWWGGSKYELEVRLVTGYMISQWVEGVLQSVGFKHSEKEMPGVPPLCCLGRMAELQTYAHAQAENVLISHSAGDRS